MSAVVDTLLEGLKNNAPATRIETLRVLAMIEETQALPMLRQMMNAEKDAEVLKVLKWAGALVWRAQQSGYTTETGMHQYFRLDLQKTDEQKKEEQLLDRLNHQFDMDMLKEKQAAQNRQIGGSIVMGALGAALSGPALGANVLMSSASKNAQTQPSYDAPRPVIGGQPITPQRPTDHDISIWLRRLKEGETRIRQQALIELRSLNNPKALSALAECYALDPEPVVRDEAQRSGKALYFNLNHWGPTTPQDANAARQTSSSDVAQILAKAQAVRDARNKKK